MGSAFSEKVRLISLREIIFQSNLYDHDRPTSPLQTDRRTDRRTDGRTDGWTTCLGNTALLYASRGNNQRPVTLLTTVYISNFQQQQQQTTNFIRQKHHIHARTEMLLLIFNFNCKSIFTETVKLLSWIINFRLYFIVFMRSKRLLSTRTPLVEFDVFATYKR